MYWGGLWKDVRNFIRTCSICQRFKSENIINPRLLHPLLVPSGVFTDITMDFIERLPKSRGKSCVFMVMDWFTKYAHFMALQCSFTMVHVVQFFLDNVYKLHGMSNTITSDRGTIFISQFWREVFMLKGVGL